MVPGNDAAVMEVLAANGVTVMIAEGDEYTPTPAISHAILCYNRGRTTGLADGIVITPSHNPPQSGGYKYNPTNGGPADTHITKWIEAKANELLANQLAGVKRILLRSKCGKVDRHCGIIVLDVNNSHASHWVVRVVAAGFTFISCEQVFSIG